MFEAEDGGAQWVESAALSGLFKLFAAHVRCVVLNACYSEAQARAVAEHIPYVVGMTRALGGDAAITFSTAFYDALGAGEAVPFAYEYPSIRRRCCWHETV